jgi:hypothetical protein
MCVALSVAAITFATVSTCSIYQRDIAVLESVKGDFLRGNPLWLTTADFVTQHNLNKDEG